MASSPHIQFRALGALETAISERATGVGASPTQVVFSEVARRDLGRYYFLLQSSLTSFSEDEAMLLCDVLNGHINQPETAHLLWIEVQDAIGEGLAEKWQVDGPALVERLRSLELWQCMAIEDAVERFWQGSLYKDAGSTAKKLRLVGLVREG